jgi:hypothetical protein
MSSHKKVNFDTDNFASCFKALLRVHSDLLHATVTDSNRAKYSVKILSDAVYGFIPRSTDDIRTNANGGLVLANIIRREWLHFKASWQVMGVNAGSLLDIVDQNGNPAPMTMNGISIDISDIKVRSALNKVTNFPPDVAMETLQIIQKAMETHIEFDFDRIKTDEPLSTRHLLQSFHIKTQNKLYTNKARIREALQASMCKMVHNHAESIAMKDSIKLNLAMLEQAECMLTGQKDKKLIDNIVDNFWGLINQSALLPTYKHEMTSVIMNLRRDRDMGQYLELDHVLNQIVSVFSNDDEQTEELAAMMASDVHVVRTGYRPNPSNQNSSDTQSLMQ